MLRAAIATLVVAVGMLASSARAPAIVGGTPVDPGAYPWYAQFDQADCGGTLIAPDRVLTSADCLGAFTMGLHVRLGHVRRRVIGVATDPGYTAEELSDLAPDAVCGEDVFCLPDVAIVGLDHPVRGVKPLRIGRPHAGQRALTLGSGDTSDIEGEGTTGHLRAARLTIMTRSDCRRHYSALEDGIVCATAPPVERMRSICFGDEGGPLAVHDRAAWRVVGIASAQRDCGGNRSPSMFASPWSSRVFALATAPVWRPEPRGESELSGGDTPGSTVTCRSARWDPTPTQPLIYVYRTSYARKSFTEQIGPSPTYVIKPSDQGGLQCFVIAVNAGGVGLDITWDLDLGFDR